MKNENTYRTKDFYHSAVLKALGFDLLDLDRSEGNFSVFIFADEGSKAEEILKEYWNRTLKVEPRAMVESINELKQDFIQVAKSHLNEYEKLQTSRN